MTTYYYRNEYLFSEIYLQEITQQPEDTEILASLTTLKEYREWARTATIQEWKDSFVHEVLYALGFGIKSENERLTLLYPVGRTETPLTLCYVLLPTEDLDNTTIGRNWAEKVIRSLRHHNLKWGLLTNGEKWRIYHLDESTPYEIFLEMNLAAILSDSASQDYQIFHKFMKVEIFTKDEQGQCRLDMFKKESLAKIDYIESELANALKQKEEGGKGVLSNLCMGYVEFLKASGNPNLDDDALRRKIYHGAMLYMFRLLFLFYADARSLLNETNSRLLKDVLQRSKAVSPNDTSASNYSIWEDLESIFVDIDQSYNGGLFDPHESEFTQFIEESRVNDAYLASAVHYLTSYQERSREEKVISYRDMSVRHLGTLYEGLLEHKLFIAKEDTEVRAAKDKIQFIPASQGGRIIAGRYIPAGQVYFGGDRSERKATGSFYTPEYIVDYNVRNTVGEKLSQLRQDFLVGQKDLLIAVGKAIDQKELKALAELLEDNLKTFIKEKVLKLSVLDLAMGSGHFLVNTSNCIANFITEILNEFETIGTTETSTTYWRRWVVENCVYGVDVNPLAVELAKLSLWILSMSKEKPLSFLNHNLKTGNSLIGARLDDIGKYPGKGDKKQHSIFSDDQDFKEAVGKAISNYVRITSTDSASLDVIADKKAWLDEIDDILKPYKLICDVHTSIYFGNEVSEWKYKELIDKKDIDHSNYTLPSYFHWELEFPGAFLKNCGFDVVIGNPPWVSYGLRGHSALNKLDEEYLRRTFVDSAEYKLSLYALFMEAAIRLTKSSGYHSFIVPDSFLLGKYFTQIRKFMLSTSNIKKIVLFIEDFWSGASIGRCVIYIIKREPISSKRSLGSVKVIEAKTLKEFGQGKIYQNEYGQSTFENTYLNRYRLFFSDKARLIVEKMEKCSVPMANVVKFYSGLIGKDGKESIVIRKLPTDYSPVLYGKLISSGKYLRRYNLQFIGEYILRDKKLYKSGFDEKKYLSPKLFLNQTGDSFKACYDAEGYFCLNNMHIGYPVSAIYDLRFINSILCSRLMNYYYHTISLEMGRAMAQIDIETIDQLPLPNNKTLQKNAVTSGLTNSLNIQYEEYIKDPNKENLTDISENMLEMDPHNSLVFLVNKMIELNETEIYDQTGDTIHKFAIDNLIDKIVYRLYDLNEEEILFIEEQNNR